MARGLPPPDGDRNNNQSTSNEQFHNMPSHRRHPLSLPLAIPLYTPQASVEMVQEGGEVLFRQYVMEEMQNNNIPQEPPILNIHPGAAGDSANVNSSPMSAYEELTPQSLYYRGQFHSPMTANTPTGYHNNEWARYGRDLRDLANAFAESREGSIVRQRAEETVLTDITEQHFWDLLTELFAHGFSKERLIALFYYCGLLIIRSRRAGFGSLTGQLFNWSLRYIRDQVCQWVYEHGGWGKVFQDIWYLFLKLAFGCTVVVGLAFAVVYLRKNW